MEKYLTIRVQTALYISIFFVSLHYVFVYLTNSSILKYIFGLKTSEVLSIYGGASLFAICIYLLLLKIGIAGSYKRNILRAAIIEIICLGSMYYFSLFDKNIYAFVALFFIHNMITPYIMFNLDSLFETYVHIEDRGKGRGIYLTVWNMPFFIVPIIMSSLSVEKLPIVYLVSSTLLIPFIYLTHSYLKNPTIAVSKDQGVFAMLRVFFTDTLDRKSFTTQTLLNLYYGCSAVILPIYLHSVFLFNWDKIGLILAAMTAPFVLMQIPFGNMEDKEHNEKGLFKIGLFTTIFFSVLFLFVSPSGKENTPFLLLSLFLFLSHTGCSLIEISTESMFYKHVTERDHTALLMFRLARILPYSLGILALLFV